MTLSVCIFAHNEERLLPGCVAALDAAADGMPFTAHILENGSTDATAAVATALAAADPRLNLKQLDFGDKSNAWNFYVHSIAGNADAHIFIDGDVTPGPKSFRHLLDALETDERAYAAAALPAAGRSQKDWSARTLTEKHINGNLYALSAEGIKNIRERNIYLPVGSVGEDGLLRYVLATDLKGGRDDSHDYRITVASDAWFDFDSLQFSKEDLTLYRKRLQRYSKRHFQNKILYPILKNHGIEAMPETIDEIYTAQSLVGLRPRLSFENFVIDLQTLKALREKVARTKAA